ncbi:class I SAM-dependent DNA methyltransferase [Desulfopila inferna]|uniref:class I SAM-dependent DNA methyltransferase n=1 Tax=Desulfopila inferna TaxID=468528 RepID=UPI001963C804|nr:class I SAM-dependent methyltransferase [Desulfopila inferna]MBM9603817.1 class I SAM-dependent methyltransferase [Desulfopila inferna]
MNQETPELWKATYEAKTPQELIEAYGKWAHLYDNDTLEVMGYVGPKVAADMLDFHLESQDSRVLDAGCGTGLVGEILDKLGYENVDAMDFSADMLSEAEKKEVYRKLYQEDMNGRLAIADNSYDATICVGTFTFAHVGPHAFDELVRVTRPGGHICFTIRDGAYQEYGYRTKMLEMEATEKWQLQELREEDYLVKENVTAKFCTYQVL